ncbi:hypothetical protein [Variovorax paradoxus]|uniref:Uncharacterized protein n=1 Tax=Variovorax paradoxus TaxID=34073 RepID=A0A6I6HJN7_VARPD|nr:hypothetical protein [Variovorax paradoxus]QGW83078.1 hypothetical protein GOQ09_16500 [Variovorax paradoxus]
MNTSRIFPLPLPADAVKVPSPSVHDAFKRAVESLVRRCGAATIDLRERYLSQSVDHEDLENRMREWEAYEARSRCLPPAL